MIATSVSPLGPAPIVDFDGTMAYLPVDWAALRRELGVTSVDQLWAQTTEARWDTVTAAELAAAAYARPIPTTLAALARSRSFVVITDNDESVVKQFLQAYPRLTSKMVAVLGRRYHGGPKRNQDVFRRAFSQAVELVRAVPAVDATEPVVYCGDRDYELEYAAGLGARTVRVSLSGQFETPPILQPTKGNR
ncbi:MAG: hypothetical protein JWL70_1273 [Acidimicrobiia bacterium]|nr:hypothetical protein [Acidimicrobiia bacterium]